MDDRDKVRRALRGLLLAFVLSALLWGVFVALFLSLQPPATGSAWWQLPWVRYGALVALVAMIALATIGEIVRIRTRRHQARTEAPTPWPVGEARQRDRITTADHPAVRHGARNETPAADDVVRLP